MDNQTNIQKRKRANTAQDEHTIKGVSDEETTIIVDTSHYRKPSIIEDDSDDSDVEQPDSIPIQKSTLFWSTQLVISRQKDDEIGLAKPSIEHKMKNTLALLRKIFIILLSSNLN